MSRATGLRHVIFITITPDCHECSRESYGIPQMGSEEFPHSPADGRDRAGLYGASFERGGPGIMKLVLNLATFAI